MPHILILIFAWLLVPGPAYSGTIKGTATYSGGEPSPAPYKTGKFKKACGDEVPNETLIVENKKLMNVVVSLQGKQLQAKPKEYHLDQKRCHYEPHVVAMPKGSELEIHTSDPINHNIHTYSFDNDPINLMFTPGQEGYSQEFEEPEIIKVECDLHSWMTAWIVVTPNSYFAVSGKIGNFEIPDVPSGNYQLTAWHEALGSLTRNITVGKGDTVVDFDFSEVTPEVSKK